MESTPAAVQKPRVLSVQQAAQELNVGRSTIYQMAAAGEIRSVKARGRILIPAVAIDEFLAPKVPV